MLIENNNNNEEIIDELKKIVKQKGLKYTEQREIVLSILLHAKEHLTAEEVYNEINSSLQYSLENLNSYNFPDSIGDLVTFKSIIDQASSIFDNIRYTLLKYENIPLLNELISDSQTVILVGKNGVGKSTLIDDLKTDKFHNLFCIPAQKYLYVTDLSNVRVDNIDGIHQLFTNNPLKVKTTFSYIGADGDPYKIFSLILNFVMREHQMSKSDYNSPTKSKLDIIISLFSSTMS